MKAISEILDDLAAQHASPTANPDRDLAMLVRRLRKIASDLRVAETPLPKRRTERAMSWQAINDMICRGIYEIEERRAKGA